MPLEVPLGQRGGVVGAMMGLAAVGREGKEGGREKGKRSLGLGLI